MLKPRYLTVVLSLLCCIFGEGAMDAHGHSTAEEEGLSVVPIVYMLPDRTAQIQVGNGIYAYSKVVSRKPGTIEMESAAEVTYSTTRDCGDQRLRCLNAFFSVFAVPFEFTARTREYSIEGVMFSVLQCTKTAGDRCQVAIIEAECQAVSKNGDCYSVTSSRSNKVTPVVWRTYFVYNEDFGITAIGLGNSAAKVVNRLQVAKNSLNFMLQGDIGLLKPD